MVKASKGLLLYDYQISWSILQF